MDNSKRKIILLVLLLGLNVIAYFVIKTSTPFAHEDLDLSFYNTLMIVKSAFFFAGLTIVYKIVSFWIDSKED